MNALAFKLIGGVAAAMMLFLLVADRNRWKGKAEARAEKLELICGTVRDAAGNPKLACRDVVIQISELGKSNARLKAALERQNAAVARMGAETARQKQVAAEALERATGRAKAATSVSDRLAASALLEARKSAPCTPSEELVESWR